MILYDFYCQYCHTAFEAMAKMTEKRKECPNCGKTAGRCLSTPRIRLDGCDPAFSTAYDHWGRVHEKEAKRAAKREDYGGQYHGDN